jgi:hypothetical protein
MGVTLLPVEGELRQLDEAAAILLGSTGTTLNLGFALVTMNGEGQLFPEVVLDDWGRERRGLALYSWIRDEGPYFPRADLFGTDRAGEQRQYFLRDLDLSAPYPCYAFLPAASRPEAIVSVQAICRPDPDANRPVRSAPFEGVHPLLGQADVTWWAVEPDHFHRLDIRQLLTMEA